MNIVTADQMRRIEKRAMEEYRIPSLVLMENAARSVLEITVKILKKQGLKNVCILCGTGNNGGDGLVCARLLMEQGYRVSIVYCGSPQKGSEENCLHLDIAQKLGIKILYWEKEQNQAVEMINSCDLILDAVLGTGLSSNVRENVDSLIKTVNQAQKFVVSVDIPTGINSDSGEIMGSCIKADVTVALCCYKIGNIAGEGAWYNGKLELGLIGMPYKIAKKEKLNYFALNDEECRALIPLRKFRSNKGSYGTVAVIAGSKEMTGAALIAAESAYKAGCGIVKVISVKEVTDVVHYNLKEAVTVTLAGRDGYICSEDMKKALGALENVSAVVIGPGLGNNEITAGFIKEFLPQIKIPVVLDADCLNIIAKNMDLMAYANSNWIMTPHPGEMSRLTGITVQEILKNPLKIAKDFVQKYNAVLVLKDARTIVVEENRFYINMTGSPSMAKGGSGDVLAGIIASFAAQGLQSCDVAVTACYIHGKAGEYNEGYLGLSGAMASDLINAVPFVMKEIINCG